MNRLIITLISVIAAMHCTPSFGQVKNLTKMKEKARNTYLVETAMDVLNNCGPEWNRGVIIPEVEGILNVYSVNGDDDIKDNGRKYYTVIMKYDEETQKELYYTRAAVVSIWADTGEPQDIMFGHNYGLNFTRIPYKKIVKEMDLADFQIPFKARQVGPKWEMNPQTGDVTINVGGPLVPGPTIQRNADGGYTIRIEE